MDKKLVFVKEVEELLEITGKTLSTDAETYFVALKTTESGVGKPKFTENGKKIMEFLQNNYENYNNLFSAKTTGEAMGISSRTVSGSMRALVNNGYVEKLGDKPIMYALTEEGKAASLDD